MWSSGVVGLYLGGGCVVGNSVVDRGSVGIGAVKTKC